LDEKNVDAQEMISAVNNGKKFFLYTCMIQADFLDLKKLSESNRIFKGIIENEFGETPAEFILKPNENYRKKAEELYKIAKLNFLPWRSLNLAYFYKLFDVFVTKIEDWDEQLEVKKISIEFDEFGETVIYQSTPPDKASRTFLSPTWARIALICSSINACASAGELMRAISSGLLISVILFPLFPFLPS